jgi:parvulin-like peptidyl-prolyl isomerase
MVRSRAWWAVALFAAAVTADAVFAQDIVVDGDRITADDVDQRTRFDRLATHKMPSREQVIDELRAELHDIHQLSQLGLIPSASEVDAAYADMAARMHLTADQLTRALAQQGIDARMLKQRIRADIVRHQYLRSKGVPLGSPREPVNRLLDPGPSPAGPRWCRGCVQVSDAGPATAALELPHASDHLNRVPNCGRGNRVEQDHHGRPDRGIGAVVADDESVAADEIEKRMRFAEFITHEAPSREDVIAQLRFEKRNMREAGNAGINISDAEVDVGYASIAAHQQMTAAQLTDALVRAGADVATLRQGIRAALAVARLRHRPHPDAPPGWRE